MLLFASLCFSKSLSTFMWINGISDKFSLTDNSGPVRVKIPTSDEALRQQHTTDEMATNNMKVC